MTISAFDHPFLSSVLSDDEVALAFSVEADIRAMLDFEAALAASQADVGLISSEAAARIGEVCAGFSPDIAELREGTAKDGVVVPAFVKSLRQRVGAPHAEKLHFGATSQDVIDTSLVLRLKPLLKSFTERLKGLIERLRALDSDSGSLQIMAHTRMQRALPITVSDKLRIWRDPLQRHLTRIAEL